MIPKCIWVRSLVKPSKGTEHCSNHSDHHRDRSTSRFQPDAVRASSSSGREGRGPPCQTSDPSSTRNALDEHPRPSWCSLHPEGKRMSGPSGLASHARMHIYLYIYYVYTYTYIHTCIYIYMINCVCINKYIYILYIYVLIYIYWLVVSTHLKNAGQWV